jgi:hypothetical protein
VCRAQGAATSQQGNEEEDGSENGKKNAPGVEDVARRGEVRVATARVRGESAAKAGNDASEEV